MKNQNGFTLMELLVTLGIIGVLASIALPMFSDYRKRAYDASALSFAKDSLMIASDVLISDMSEIPRVNQFGYTLLINSFPILNNGEITSTTSNAAISQVQSTISNYLKPVDNTAYVAILSTGGVLQIDITVLHCKGSKVFIFQRSESTSKFTEVVYEGVFYDSIRSFYCP